MKYGSADTVVGRLDMQEDAVVEDMNDSLKQVFQEDSSPLESGSRLNINR